MKNLVLVLGLPNRVNQISGNNNPDRVLPEYTRIDASAYYNFSDDLNIRLNIENFGDEVYFPHSHSSHQATVGEPFNARVSITRRF